MTKTKKSRKNVGKSTETVEFLIYLGFSDFSKALLLYSKGFPVFSYFLAKIKEPEARQSGPGLSPGNL